MKTKQFLLSVFIAALFIVPKELLFKPHNFWFNLVLNVAGFLIGGVVGALVFRKKGNAAAEKKPVKTEIPLAPLPEATKAEDYNKYMPK